MRKWFINFGIVFGLVFAFSFPALAKDQFITVTFKAGTDTKFVSIINLMFGTQTVEQINPETFQLKLPKFKTPDQFAELFTNLSYVAKTKPAPIYKVADHMGMQAVTVPPNTQVNPNGTPPSPGASPQPQTSGPSPQPTPATKLDKLNEKLIKKYGQQVVPTTNIPLNGGNQILVTFKPSSTQNIVEIFNLIFETEVVEKQSFHLFRLQLPPHMNPAQAERIFKLSPYVINAQRLYS